MESGEFSLAFDSQAYLIKQFKRCNLVKTSTLHRHLHLSNMHQGKKCVFDIKCKNCRESII